MPHAKRAARAVPPEAVKESSRSGALPRRVAHAVSATVAKQNFGGVLDEALHGRQVVIMKHNTPKAVLLSYEQYNALTGSAERQLEDLAAEFDTLLLKMQQPGQSAAMLRAFHATPKQISRAAVAAARKRG